MALSMSEYQLPSFLENLSGDKGIQDMTLGRLKEHLETGRNMIENQPAYQEMARAYDVLSFPAVAPSFQGYSDLGINRIRRNFRDLVATVSNLRPSGQAVTKKLEAQDSIWRLNKMKEQWWITTAQDRRYRECCQYACGLGSGYLEPWYDPNFYGPGRGEIATKVRGPASVFPVMMTEDNDLQKAFTVTIVEQIPLHIVMANYPAFAHLISPSRATSGWLGRTWNRIRSQGGGNGVLGVLDTAQKSFGSEMPVVDVMTTYTMDTSVNNSGREIQMGDPGSSWAYKVPFIGQEIPAGVRDMRGKMISKRATHEDCMIFPLRRRTIWTDTCILKDNTSPYLHGRVPLIQLKFDDTPWDFLGTSIIHDTWRIQKATNQIWRAIVDSVIVRMQPPLKYDSNVIDKAAVARLNMRQPGQTLEVGMGLGNPIEPLLPVQYWDVPPWIMQVIEKLDGYVDQLSIVKDIMAVAKAKQVPSADSIEKILEAAGPVVQDIARAGEVATQQFDALFYPLALQFWDANKVFHVLGETGAIKEALDFRPGDLIPSHLPGEDTSQPSIYDKWERVRWTVDQLSYVIEPYSQAQVSRVGRNLLLFQLFKAGFMISQNTIGKNLGLDMGELPPLREGKPAATEPEKWMVEQEIKQALAEDLQGGQQQQGQRGRPASMQKGAQVKNKDGGTRSTVSTSG